MKNANAVALGSIKSEKKSLSSRENGIEWKKPHFKKCKYFESIYPYTLENNEWKEKFAIGKTKTNRTAMYNPDYFCPTTEFFIEVTTSKPNMVEQGWITYERKSAFFGLIQWDVKVKAEHMYNDIEIYAQTPIRKLFFNGNAILEGGNK